MTRFWIFLLGISFMFTIGAWSQESPSEEDGQDQKTGLTGEGLSGLKLRSIGPALMSGRIGDIAVDPTNRSTWYVAVASGNLWKTLNRGTTWKPVFDHHGSYSMGCVTLDPSNPHVVWLGTGENASQRSVGYGDGIYRSLDGGESWTCMGLTASEHIAKILVDPRDSKVIFVAAQGPLWAPGGERGVYKSVDGGATWEAVLFVSENTGATDLVFDPRDPDVLYAAAYQRRRHVGILIGGGPESAVYKSTDGGANWRKLSRGLPEGDVGRIALAVSPMDPDVVYAFIAAAGDGSGFYRSANRGESWVKQSDHICVDPQYYGEIYSDPHRFDCVYTMDVIMHVTEDGGRTFRPVSTEYKHVDNHALVFDPDDPDYLLVGCDGGMYETWDRARTWKYMANLPITQFYRVGVDNASPIYNVFGGTQDNSTQGGPSRTLNVHGIRNSDWTVTLGGDGFQVRIDPEDPDILYCMYQYAGIVRYDRRSGERIDIQPQPGEGEEGLRWNWDSPLIVSPHSHTRLYFAANRLFRSDDRGDTWEPVSPDLTRRIDRNRMEVMGRVWSVDAVWKNVFTTPFGNITALDESPLAEGLIYAGTDDGLIQVTEDGGGTWRRLESFPGVPDLTYVADAVASRHDADTVYAVFNNHKQGDFTPYILKSGDRGRTWVTAAGDLPSRHVVWCIVEDHVKPGLLFAGTEFGLFFTREGGTRWIPLKGGLPTIPVRDLEIQRRENDLVAATFGRGFYILDDYTPLRHVTDDLPTEEARLFPVKDAWMYLESNPLGGGTKAVQGHAFYTAPNPPFGAVFTYYLGGGLKRRSASRKEKEQQRIKEGKPVDYPTWEALRGEDREMEPVILLTVSDDEGNVVRRIKGSSGRGMHRVAWDLRYPGSRPATGRSGRRRGSSGPTALPGRYTVRLSKMVDGAVTPLGQAQPFECRPLGLAKLPAADRAGRLAFQQQGAKLQRAVLGAGEVVRESIERLESARLAMTDTPAAPADLHARTWALRERFLDLQVELDGDETRSKRFEPVPPSIRDRVQRVVRGFWSSSATTTTHRTDYEIAAEAFADLLERLRILVEEDLKALQNELEKAGVPWTPGRGVPRWNR